MIEQFLTSLVRLPGAPDFLVLGLGAAIYLVITGKNLRPPWAERLKAFSIALAGFCIGNLMMAMIFGTNLRFGLLEAGSAQSESDRALSKKAKYGLAKKNLLNETTTEGDRLSGSNHEGTKKEFPPEDWRQIAHWEGSASKHTEVFHIPSRSWMIYWYTVPLGSQPGTLSLKLYRADGKLVKNVTNTMGTEKDNIMIHDSGNYYLSINANQKYRIVVMVRH